MRRLKGWGLGRGCALPSWGSGGLPQKKNQICAKNYAILSKFCTSFLYYSRKWGDYPPVLKVGGGPNPLSPPCSDAYACSLTQIHDTAFCLRTRERGSSMKIGGPTWNNVADVIFHDSHVSDGKQSTPGRKSTQLPVAQSDRHRFRSAVGFQRRWRRRHAFV